MDVSYRCDGSEESNVPLSRIVLLNDKIQAIPLLTSLRDLCIRIASLTPRQASVVSAELERAMDFALLEQMLSHNALNAKDLLEKCVYLLNRISELQAPVKAEKAAAWTGSFLRWSQLHEDAFDEFIFGLPSFFEFCSLCIDEIKGDTANFYIQMLTPIAIQKGPSYFTSSFGIALKAGHIGLDRTAIWLQNSLQASSTGQLSEAGVDISWELFVSGLKSGTDRSIILKGVAVSFVALLQTPFRLDSPTSMLTLAETLHRDASKLALIRDEVDVLALVSTVLIIVRQTLNRWKIALSKDEDFDMQNRIACIVRDPLTVLSDIIAEGVRFLRRILEIRRVDEALLGNWEEGFRNALGETVNEENVVRNLFSKRILKLVLRALLDQPLQDTLKLYSLSSASQGKMVASILTGVRRLFKLNFAIYGDFYCALFKHVVHLNNSI